MDDTTETETESSGDAACRYGCSGSGGNDNGDDDDNGDESDDEDIWGSFTRVTGMLEEKLKRLGLGDITYVGYCRGRNGAEFRVTALPMISRAEKLVLEDFVRQNSRITVGKETVLRVTCAFEQYCYSCAKRE